MMKFAAHTPDGAPVFCFGLSDANLARLREREPILIKLGDMLASMPPNLDLRRAEIIITWGPTEKDLMEEWAGGIGPDTKVHVDPRIL